MKYRVRIEIEDGLITFWVYELGGGFLGLWNTLRCFGSTKFYRNGEENQYAVTKRAMEVFYNNYNFKPEHLEYAIEWLITQHYKK